MNAMIWLRSHVERCLQDIWETSVEPDADGDYLVRSDQSAGYVSLEEGPPTLVVVRAWAVLGVPFSAKLAKELNDINASLRAGRAYWHEGRVIVSQSVVAEAVGRESLAHAYRQVFEVADDIGTPIAAVFGGEVPVDLPSETADDESAA